MLRTAALTALAAGALAATAPAAHAALEFREFTVTMQVDHEVRTPTTSAQVMLDSGAPKRISGAVYHEHGAPPIQFMTGGAIGGWTKGRLSGPGCPAVDVRSRLHLAVDGSADGRTNALVLTTGQVQGLNGFCATPEGHERDVPPPVALPGGVKRAAALRPGQRVRLTGEATAGDCATVCSTTHVTLTLRRVS